MPFSTAFISPLPITSNFVANGSFIRKPQPSKTRPRNAIKHSQITPRAAIVRPDTTPSATELETFSHAVRGEWVGYEGLFSIESGDPQPVPDYYIPEQFTEWGLTPHGFESNHSIIVRGNILYRKFFRVLPTVSLFADHVDLEEDFSSCDVGGPDGVHVFTDGSFCAGPHQVPPQRKSKLEKWPAVDFCLRDPRKDVKRAAHVGVKFDFENRKFVGDLRVIIEKYSCIYCDGADIEGSSGYVEGWVIGEKGSAENLEGEWRVVLGDDESQQEVLNRSKGDLPHTPGKIIYLAEDVDVSVMDEEDDNGVVVQVGWLVDKDTRAVIRRRFAEDGKLKFSEHVVEYRV